MNHLLVFEAPVKESEIIENQQKEINNLKEDINHLSSILENLTAQINKN